jgi:hypothetical protein
MGRLELAGREAGRAASADGEGNEIRPNANDVAIVALPLLSSLDGPQAVPQTQFRVKSRTASSPEKWPFAENCVRAFQAPTCESGGIGRRAGLRIQWGNPCRFKSCLSYWPRQIDAQCSPAMLCAADWCRKPRFHGAFRFSWARRPDLMPIGHLLENRAAPLGTTVANLVLHAARPAMDR